MKKIACLLLVGLFIVTACTSKEEPKEPVKTEYAIGETADLDGLLMTVNSTRLLEGEEYIGPDEGTQWIAVNVTFENTKEESVYVAGIFDITMKDGEGVEKDQNIWGDVVGTLDGDILSGEKLTGEKSFVITGDEENLYLYYKPSFSSKDPVKFIIK